jgi:hypothetical protein
MDADVDAAEFVDADDVDDVEKARVAAPVCAMGCVACSCGRGCGGDTPVPW